MGSELTNPNKTDENVISIFSVGDNSYGNITYLNKKELNIKQLFIDNYYQCFAIDINNNLYSWGLNNYYQLANGKNSKYLFNTEETASKKINESNFSIISSSANNTISKTIKNIGSFFINQSPIPIHISKIKNISCGDGFTLFLSTEGVVYSVGKNDKGQLGYELNNTSASFVDGIKCNNKVTPIDYFIKNKINIKHIACGSDFCFALEDNNSNISNINIKNSDIYSWGNNELHQLGISENKYKYYFKPTKADLVNKIIDKIKARIIKFICGWSHTCFLSENNGIYLWGNPFKEYNKKYKDIQEPININNINKKIIDISSGFNHIAILTALSKQNNNNNNSLVELYTFGANEFGQLGYPTEEIYIDRFNKVTIPKNDLNKNLNITKVSCGAYHTLVQIGSNLIYGFGQNNCKQIGNYPEEYISTPKKWNYLIDTQDDKILYDIKCSNGISCLLYKNKSQIKENEDIRYFYKNKNDVEIQVNSFLTENVPLKKII